MTTVNAKTPLAAAASRVVRTALVATAIAVATVVLGASGAAAEAQVGAGSSVRDSGATTLDWPWRPVP